MDLDKNAAINAARLKKMRELKGYSQNQFAVATGTSVNNIKAYENARRDLGRAEGYTLLKYATVLGCKVEDLIICKQEDKSE